MGNPVFARAEAFQPHSNQQVWQGQQGYPQGYQQSQSWGGQPAAAGPGYDPYAQQSQPVMTFDDVVAKTGLVLLTIFAIGVVTYLGVIDRPGLAGGAALLSALVGFVTVMIVASRAKVPVAGVIAYAVIEGVFIGAISAIFERMFPGIVVQAVLGTFCAAGVTLAAYKFLNIRVTSRFRQVVTIATIGFAVAMLANLVMAFFVPAGLGLRAFGAGAGWLPILCSAIGVVLAAMNLVVDFDSAEQGVRNQAPASESWRAAFGVAVTMVWLYTEILRILSYFRSN
ncbi:Bax inhibitor-1/YccA family protein [Acidipropionibacterium jensenii]|uniref:Bax inhibitor-1/YccA family protein n=1 Tax=Acidipropionibacterium jensenii TaxID=1749 RepID=UPI00214BD990|nr:Bax inhibitor-1/YccA family protein [Acidipropionibacterium jensenii]